MLRRAVRMVTGAAISRPVLTVRLTTVRLTTVRMVAVRMVAVLVVAVLVLVVVVVVVVVTPAAAEAVVAVSDQQPDYPVCRATACRAHISSHPSHPT
jgi:hypothetical protein